MNCILNFFKAQLNALKHPGRRRFLQAVLVASLALCLVFPGVAAALGAPYAFAAIQFQLGHFRQARQALEDALQRFPGDATAEMLLARCDYTLGDVRGATAHAEAAVRIDPGNAENHLWLGRILGREANREHSVTLALRTKREFEKAVSLSPKDAEARRALMEYYLDAPWLLGGSKAKAHEQAEAIARISPVEGWLAQAQLDEKAGRWQQEDADYRLVIRSKPQSVDPYFEAADFYVGRRDIRGLRQAVEAAAALNTTDRRIDYYRGVADVLAGSDLISAERELKLYVAKASALQDVPSRAEALSWLGTVYERMGNKRLALQQYEAALQIDPQSRDAQQGLQRLNQSP